MRDFLKRLFARETPQQLGLEIGSRRTVPTNEADDDDNDWLKAAYPLE